MEKLKEIVEKLKNGKEKISVTLSLDKKDYKQIQQYLKKANKKNPCGNKIKFSNLINLYMKEISLKGMV